jgi:hypothetical protein
VSNGFIKVDILAPIKEPFEKAVERKNEAQNSLLELLEGCLRRMDDTVSWKDVSVYRNPPRNSHSDDI